jgi:hypothetical protein
VAIRFHELPVALFTQEQQPHIARLNRELRDLFGLEGVLTGTTSSARSDRTIARGERQTVSVTRVEGALELGAGTPTTINAGDVGATGNSNKAAPWNHEHPVSTAGAGDIAVIGNTTAAGATGKLADAGHVHGLSTAGDQDYLRRDGVTTVTGIIIPDSDAVRDFGSNTAHFAGVHGGAFGVDDSNGAGIGAAQFKYANASAADTGLFVTGGNIYVMAPVNNHWRAAAIDPVDTINLALETLTPLNRLAAATGTYDMDGNTLTDWGGCTSSNAALLNLKADVATASGVIGMAFDWEPASGSTGNNSWIAALRYKNTDWESGVTRDVFKFGFSAADDAVMWLRPQGTGSTDECHIMAGENSGTGWSYGNASTCGFRMLPNFKGGSMWIYGGNSVALKIENTGNLVSLASPWNLAGENPFKITNTNGVAAMSEGGAFQIGFTNNLTPVSGRHTGFFRGIVPGTGGNMTTLFAAVDYRGWFESGQAGDITTVPGDGGSGATGWTAADGDGGDKTGSDYYIFAGKGTGDSTTKGDIIFQTPDAGASGTTVQSLTTKATLYREGNLVVNEVGADSDVGGLAGATSLTNVSAPCRPASPGLHPPPGSRST